MIIFIQNLTNLKLHFCQKFIFGLHVIINHCIRLASLCPITAAITESLYNGLVFVVSAYRHNAIALHAWECMDDETHTHKMWKHMWKSIAT